MSAMLRGSVRVAVSSRRHVSGFGLIELMIAMVLGLVVMGAAFAVFISNQNTFRANEGLNRIQENARIAFELMSRDIRAAGGSACSNVSLVESTGGQSDLFRDTPVTGTATTLNVVSADDSAYRVLASTSSSVNLDPTQIADARDAFSDGDLILLCNARKTFLVQASTVETGRVNHTALPAGYVPTADEFAPPAAVVVARFRNVQWFVAPNTRGGSSLWVTRMGGAPEEVADGVQDIEFSYLRAGQTAYVTNPPRWDDVVAVRITMTLTGQDIDGQALERTASNVVSLRSRTL